VTCEHFALGWFAFVLVASVLFHFRPRPNPGDLPSPERDLDFTPRRRS